MKTIGIIGGLSWESTIEYYRIINQEVSKALGGLHSAKILLESLEFSEIVSLQRAGKWDEIIEILIDSAKRLKTAGADVVLIATNTLHRFAPQVQTVLEDTPLLHIADATAREIKNLNIKKVALLGTKYTMQEDFYKGKFINEYSIEVVVPSENQQELIHGIIFDELCQGIITERSENILQKVIEHCKKDGAQAVVLGCTELPNIIKKAPIPILNTAQIHSIAAVEFALKKETIEV